LALVGAVLLGCTWCAAQQPPGDARQPPPPYRDALATLTRDPNDPAANFVVGKYFALNLGNWDKGLAHLVKGNNLAYKLIARADLGGPTEPNRQRELGDDWWELAQSESGPHATRLRERAAFWYSKAFPELKGESAVAVKQRITALAAELAALKKAAPTDVPETLDPKHYLGIALHEGDPMLKAVTMRFGIHLPEQPDPAKPGQKKRLTFDPLGRSNNTCLKIEGVEQLVGMGGGSWKVQKEALGGNRVGVRSVWLTDDLPIKVTQVIELVRGDQTRKLDTCLVRYTIENTSKKKDYKVGLRFLLDTFIGTNDGAPFIIPGEATLCETMRDLKGAKVPSFVQAVEDARHLDKPGTVASLRLKLGGGVEAPTRVTLGAWPSPDLMVPGAAGSDTLWNVPLFSMKQLKMPDSAATIYWDEKPLAPEAKREVGFSYGLGNYSGDPKGGLGLIVGGQLYEGGTAEVVALVAGPANQQVTLKVPAGLVIEGNATQTVANPPAGADHPITPLTWKVRSGRSGLVNFIVTSSTGASAGQDVRILDKVTAPPEPVDLEAAIKKELEKWQGTWYVESERFKGKEMVAKTPLKVVIVGQTMTVHRQDAVKGAVTETSFFKIDPTAAPQKIDIFPPQAGVQEVGIFRWQEDKLQIILTGRRQVLDNAGKVIVDAESFRPRAFDTDVAPLLLLSRTDPTGKQEKK
jgi:uncharacterized protein (TIGR03067 family)